MELCAQEVSSERVVFERSNEFQIIEGRDCGEKKHKGSNIFKTAIENIGIVSNTVDDNPSTATTRINFDRKTWVLPSYADEAAVFLNGLSVSYQKKDHHIKLVGAKLENIAKSGSALVWDSGIDLSDRNGDDGVDACLYYTGVAWNSDVYDASIDTSYEMRRSGSTETVPSLNWPANNFGTNTYRNFAALPTGYIFIADDGDRHLLQFAYSLIHPTFANPTNTVEVVSILKDNDAGSDVLSLADIDVLHGSGISVLLDEFRPTSINHCTGIESGCISGPPGFEDPEYVDFPSIRDSAIDDFSADVVIPVLSGFNLRFGSDKHVKHLRAYLHNINYDREFTRLNYQVVTGLTDKSDRRFATDHSVTFVGLNKRSNNGQVTTPVGSLDQGEHAPRP